MSTGTTKELIRQWWEVVNQGTGVERVDDFYTADYVLHDPSQPEPIRGIEGVRAFVAAIATGFPDIKITIDDLLAEGDKVIHRVTARGTHQGAFQGIPATGKSVEIWIMVISRIANNKIAEEWELVDTLRMLQQLGVVPL